MNILQINSVYKTGSTGKIAKDLNDLIIAQGWQSHIGYGRGAVEDANAIRIGSDIDMYMHIAGTRALDKHGLYSKKATERFLDEIEKLDIDIYHLHNIHGYYLHYPTLFEYLQRKNKPVVWTLHDCWAFTGHCAYYEYAECDKWLEGCGECPQLGQYPKSLFADHSAENFSLKQKYFTGLENLTIVTPSKWLKAEVEKSFLSLYPSKVIHNGIDLEIFKPRESPFRQKYNLQGKFVILGVASVWEERKGLDYFFKLAKMLKTDEHIVLIGLNEKQIQTLPANITGITRTENQIELAEIYTSANVFANPTLEEALGLTNLEALACGTPVVTFESGGSPEAIDLKAGIVVFKGDLAALYDAIGIIKNKITDNFSTEVCRERAENLFDKNDRFREYINLYNNFREGAINNVQK